MLISYLIKTQTHTKWQEKIRSFECGFDSNHTNRLAFSLRFFIITIVFLVFDIEVAIILPLPLSENKMLVSETLISNFMFFSILIGGLIFEWKQGALEWSWKNI